MQADRASKSARCLRGDVSVAGSGDLLRASPRWFMCGLLLALLTGCAEPLPKLAAPVPAQWQNVVAAGPATRVDLHAWWHAFGDAQLDALVERAMADNLDVAQAIERLRAVRTLQRNSGARYLPSLGVSTKDVIDPDASAAYFLVGFDASWELGLFGRAEGTRRQAQGALDAGVADLRTVQVSLVAEVVREWIGLRTAQHQQQLLTHISANRQREWHTLQTRRSLGLTASSFVQQAQAAFEQSEAALAAPREAINASLRKLALLLGQAQPDPSWTQLGKVPQLGGWKLDSAPAELLRTRPEIARAEADVLQAAGAQALAHADMYPSIGLGGSIDWSTDINNNHRHSSTPNTIESLGPELNIPLFDWGIRLAAKRAKDHELKAAVLAYRQAVLQGVAEVETALGSVQQQEQREQHSASAMQSLQQADRSVQTRLDLRLASPLERIESGIATDQAALELTDARAAHSLAYVALFKALGGAPLPDTAAESDDDDDAAQARP